MYKRIKKVKIPSDPNEAFARALKTAFNIVSYKDNTLYELKSKLSERGYGEETVHAVCEYMTEKGYVNDERMMYRLARSLAQSKLYGKRRIVSQLSLRRFDKEVLNTLDFDSDELSDIDFKEICLKLLIKRGGERDEKTYAFLLRYGHSPSDIKAAYKEFEIKCDEEKYDKA